MNRGAPTIDWRVLFDRVADFADELRSRNPLKGDSTELVEQLGVTRHLVGRVIASDGEG